MTNATIRPLKTHENYRAAVKRIESLMEAEEGTPQADELEILATLVEIYEERHFPMDFPEPIEAIRFRMEQAELSAQDLIPLIGNDTDILEILSGKHQLTRQMIHDLDKQLGIPAEVLLSGSKT